MKILYLHQYFVTPKSSGGIRSYNFAKKLAEMGHEVSIITSYQNATSSKNWQYSNENGINVYRFPLNYSNYSNFYNRIKSFIKFAWKAFLKGRNLDGDIIFASSTPLTIAIPAILISWLKSIPMIFEVRDLWPDVPIAMKILKNPILIYLSKILEKFTYIYADSIIALSPDMKKGIVNKNISPEKIAIIPNSSDLEMFKYEKNQSIKFRNDRSWLKDSPLLIYTGTFGKVNNLSYAVLLAEELKKIKSEIKILLVGDGIERKELIDMAIKKDVFNKNLFFEDPIPKKNLSTYLSAANMTANFVINIKENWANSANKFFDGLAAGKPIFLNHGGWMQDFVTKYKCGLCMHGKNLNEVAKELDLILSDKKMLKSMSQASKKLAKLYFDKKIHVDQLETIFTLTLNNKLESTSKVTKKYFN